MSMAPIDRIGIMGEILRLRFSQMLVNEEYKAGKFKIPIHLAMGHEAIAVAVSHVMQAGDRLLLSHRNIAYNLAREGRIKPILDEYFLRPTGLAQGKLGSMNLINPKRDIIYASSILGNNLSVAAGVAMAEKICGRCRLTIVLAGDGSIEEGSFYESLLMMRSYALPVLVLIENNEWSLATRIEERRCHIDLQKLAGSLGVGFEGLSGNDPYYYIERLSETRNAILGQSAPSCVEVKVSTLGDWRIKTPENPVGRFVNYHAGPSPSVEVNNWPGVLRTNEEDPVFALRKHFDEKLLIETSVRIREEVYKELT